MYAAYLISFFTLSVIFEWCKVQSVVLSQMIEDVEID